MDVGYLTELYNQGVTLADNFIFPNNEINNLEQILALTSLVAVPLGILGHMLYSSARNIRDYNKRRGCLCRRKGIAAKDNAEHDFK